MKPWASMTVVVLLSCGGNGIKPGSFIARESACAASWGRTLGDSMGDDVAALAYAPDGSLFVLGRYAGSLALGGLPVTVAPQMFLAKVAPRGELDWIRPFGAGVEGKSLAVDSSGAVFFGGTAPAGVDFGGGSPAGEQSRSFVVKLDALGEHAWTTWLFEPQPTGTVRPELSQLAVDDAGNLVLLATFGASLRLGDQSVTGAPINLGVAKLGGSDGKQIWVRHFPIELKTPGLLSLDVTGIAIAGLYDGALKLGEAALPVGTNDIFWARFSADDGRHLGSAGFASNGFGQPTALASRADGSAVLVGDFHGTLGPLTSAGDERDIFWLGVDATGALQSSFRFGGPGADAPYGLALNGGDVWMTGWVSNGAELGTTLIGRPGQATGFVARMTAAGEAREVIAFDGSGEGIGRTLVLRSGCLAVAGTFGGGEVSVGATRVGIFDSRAESRSFIAQLKTTP